jgi:hypothetical protein
MTEAYERVLLDTSVVMDYPDEAVAAHTGAAGPGCANGADPQLRRRGPVGVSTLAVAVGEEATTVEEVCEPFLVRAGMIARTPRGRVATPQAWTHLGMTPPPRASGLGQPGLFE